MILAGMCDVLDSSGVRSGQTPATILCILICEITMTLKLLSRPHCCCDKQEECVDNHPNIPASVRIFLNQLTQIAAIEQLILFGSRAIGDHDERSDADIAVCGPTITPLTWARIKDAANNTQSLYRISLVHLDRNPARLQRRIMETGIRIYVRAQAS